MKTEFSNEITKETIHKWANDHAKYLVIKELVKTIGNDQELGEKIRNLINKENETFTKR